LVFDDYLPFFDASPTMIMKYKQGNEKCLKTNQKMKIEPNINRT
jgi:hypothetical protein